MTLEDEGEGSSTHLIVNESGRDEFNRHVEHSGWFIGAPIVLSGVFQGIGFWTPWWVEKFKPQCHQGLVFSSSRCKELSNNDGFIEIRTAVVGFEALAFILLVLATILFTIARTKESEGYLLVTILCFVIADICVLLGCLISLEKFEFEELGLSWHFSLWSTPLLIVLIVYACVNKRMRQRF